MKTLLLSLIVLESSLLIALSGLAVWPPDWLQADSPKIPVFRPPIDDAEGGERVEYKLSDKKTGRGIGFLSYKILKAIEIEGTNLGRHFEIEIVFKPPSGSAGRKQRLILHSPHAHGFFPPVFDEDQLPTGHRPVLKSIRSATFTLRTRQYDGFEINSVLPAWGVDEVRDRVWLTGKIPVFGVVRRELDGVVWELIDYAWKLGQRGGQKRRGAR